MVNPDNCLLYVDASGLPGHDGGDVPYFDGTEESGADSGNGRYAVFRSGWETGYSGTDADWAELKLSDIVLLSERAKTALMAPGTNATYPEHLSGEPTGRYRLTDARLDYPVPGVVGYLLYPVLAHGIDNGVFGRISRLFSGPDDFITGGYFDADRGDLHRVRRLTVAVSVSGGARHESHYEKVDGQVVRDDRQDVEDYPMAASTHGDDIWECGGLADPGGFQDGEESEGGWTLRRGLAHYLFSRVVSSQSAQPSGTIGIYGEGVAPSLLVWGVDTLGGYDSMFQAERYHGARFAFDTTSAFGSSSPWDALGFSSRLRPQDGDPVAGPLAVGEPEGTVKVGDGASGGPGSLYLTQPVEETAEQARRILKKVKDFVAFPMLALDCTDGVLAVSGVPEVMGASGDGGFEPATMENTIRRKDGKISTDRYRASWDETDGTWSDFDPIPNSHEETDGDSREETMTITETLVGQEGPYREFHDSYLENTTGSASPGRRWSGGLAPVSPVADPAVASDPIELGASVFCRGTRGVMLSKERDSEAKTHTIGRDEDNPNDLVMATYSQKSARDEELRSSYSKYPDHKSGDQIMVSGVVSESGGPLRMCLVSHVDDINFTASATELPAATVGRCDKARQTVNSTREYHSFTRSWSSCDDGESWYESASEAWEESSGWDTWTEESGDSWYGEEPWEESFVSWGGEGFGEESEPWWGDGTHHVGESWGGTGIEESWGGTGIEDSLGGSGIGGGAYGSADTDDCGPGWPASPLLDNNGLGRHVNPGGTAIVSYHVFWTRSGRVETTRKSYGYYYGQVPARPDDPSERPGDNDAMDTFVRTKGYRGAATVTRSYPWEWDDDLRYGVFEHPPMDKDFVMDLAFQAGVPDDAFTPPMWPGDPQVVLGQGDHREGSSTVINSTTTSCSVQLVGVVATGSLGKWPGD